MPDAHAADGGSRSPGSTTTQVGDLTRHTQSILERAQAYADAMRAETDQVLATARDEAARIRAEVQSLNDGWRDGGALRIPQRGKDQ